METGESSRGHLLIKIESFSLLMEHGMPKRVDIYADSGSISVYLNMVGTSFLPENWDISAMFSIYLLNQITNKYVCLGGKEERFNAVCYKRGFQQLISKSRITDPSSGYLVDDNCVFLAEVCVVKSRPTIDCVSLQKITAPSKKNWTISQFSKLGSVWTSEEFLSRGLLWKIMLYPTGKGRGEGRCISIYVELVDSKSFSPHQKVKALIRISINNKRCQTYHSYSSSYWFSSSAPEAGFAEFISIEDMHDSKKGFIVDDCCFLETEISVQAICNLIE